MTSCLRSDLQKGPPLAIQDFSGLLPESCPGLSVLWATIQGAGFIVETVLGLCQVYGDIYVFSNFHCADLAPGRTQEQPVVGLCPSLAHSGGYFPIHRGLDLSL